MIIAHLNPHIRQLDSRMVGYGILLTDAEMFESTLATSLLFAFGPL